MTEQINNYDLLGADSGVKLEWSAENKRLEISGEGYCSLGDVRGSLYVKGRVEATANKVEGHARAMGSAKLKVEIVDADVEGWGHGKLEAKGVFGNALSFEDSSLIVEVVHGKTESCDDSTINVHLAKGQATSNHHSKLYAIIVNGDAFSYGHSRFTANIVRGGAVKHENSRLDIGVTPLMSIGDLISKIPENCYIPERNNIADCLCWVYRESEGCRKDIIGAIGEGQYERLMTFAKEWYADRNLHMRMAEASAFVKVVATTEDLDADDEGDVEGDYDFILDLPRDAPYEAEELIKDEFHENVAIAVLDDFDIEYTYTFHKEGR